MRQVNSRSIYTSFRDNTRHFYFVISTVAGHFSLENETASLLRECTSSSRQSFFWVIRSCDCSISLVRRPSTSIILFLVLPSSGPLRQVNLLTSFIHGRLCRRFFRRTARLFIIMMAFELGPKMEVHGGHQSHQWLT